MDGFEMQPGASEGYVLTSDILGVGTWQHSSGSGFSLPYNDSWAGSGAAFEVVNNDSNGEAIKGRSTQGAGVYGSTSTGTGVYATALSGDAVHAVHSGSSGYGVLAQSSYGTAVRGESDSGTAVYGESTSGYAGEFNGNVTVSGTLSKGGGSFKIDHPLDPENKYLYHSFVESPDMMNVYNGNAVLDENGEATIEMPEWFEALNTDFRYQLTCIGGFAPVYVAEEIRGNSFRIAGGSPGLKVSWQVTGIRGDAFAQANRIPVEEDKPDEERGSYLHPMAFGR